MLADPENLEYLNLHRLVDFTDKNVLEIGSGDGRVTAQYRDIARSVVAIDLDVEELEYALDDATENTSILLANTLDLPFPDGSFDIALFAWSL